MHKSTNIIIRKNNKTKVCSFESKIYKHLNYFKGIIEARSDQTAFYSKWTVKGRSESILGQHEHQITTIAVTFNLLLLLILQHSQISLMSVTFRKEVKLESWNAISLLTSTDIQINNVQNIQFKHILPNWIYAPNEIIPFDQFFFLYLQQAICFFIWLVLMRLLKLYESVCLRNRYYINVAVS